MDWCVVKNAPPVPLRYCVGCGVCVGACPTGALEQTWLSKGRYYPKFVRKKCVGCSICIDVCPQVFPNSDSGEISDKKFRSEKCVRVGPYLGRYKVCYSGYDLSPDSRWKSASGGLASWLLLKLLDQVDAVVCVFPAGRDGQLFEYKVCYSAAEIFLSKGSAYYPTELSSVVKHMLSHDETYAVIGVPCFIRSVELLKSKFPKLQQQIKYTLGLTCGQMKSALYTDYLLLLSGACLNEENVHFRTKIQGNPSSNYAFTSKSGQRPLSWNDGVSDAWCGEWFNLPACAFCDDIFAECADVSFMDAWLPEFVEDSAGTSLVVVRNSQLDDIFQQGASSGEIYIREIAGRDVERSQQGVVEKKRGRNFHFRCFLRRFCKGVPCKRDFMRGEKVNVEMGLDLFWKVVLDAARVRGILLCKYANLNIRRFDGLVNCIGVAIRVFRVPEKVFLSCYHALSVWRKNGL